MESKLSRNYRKQQFCALQTCFRKYYSYILSYRIIWTFFFFFAILLLLLIPTGYSHNIVASIYIWLQLNSSNLIIISIYSSHVFTKVRSWSVMISLLWMARTKDLKNTALANPLSIRRLTDEWIERSGGTIIKRVKPNCWEKTQSRCPFVHHKFYVHCPGTETGLHGENPSARQAHKLQQNLAHIESAYNPFSAEITTYNGQHLHPYLPS